MSEKLASLKKVGGGGYNTLIIDNNGDNYNSTDARTIDIKTYLPNDYQNLTLDNFSLADVNLILGIGRHSSNLYVRVLDSYNPTTGILNCNMSCYYGSGDNKHYAIAYNIKVTY